MPNFFIFGRADKRAGNNFVSLTISISPINHLALAIGIPGGDYLRFICRLYGIMCHLSLACTFIAFKIKKICLQNAFGAIYERVSWMYCVCYSSTPNKYYLIVLHKMYTYNRILGAISFHTLM